MTDTNTRLATFRINENTWSQFTQMAKANGSNATATLIAAVNSYLHGDSSNQLSPSYTDNSPAIVVAIANQDSSIIFLDRTFKSHSWTPPYQLRDVEHHAEWLTCSDSSLLPLVENILVDYLKPKFNFQLPTRIYHTEEPSIQSAESAKSTVPSHLIDRIDSLLNHGFTAEDIHRALNSLYSPTSIAQPTPQPIPEASPSPPPPPQNDHLSPALETITSSFNLITDRLNHIEEKLNPPASPKPETLTSEEKPPLKNKPKPIPAPPRGTASPEELPNPLTTRPLADRLGITADRLEKTRANYRHNPEGFFRYTLQKENGKFGWLYDPEKQWHFPCIEFPNEEIKATEREVVAQINEPTPTKKRRPNLEPISANELGSRMVSAKTGEAISGNAVLRAWERCQHKENPSKAFADYCHKNKLRRTYEYKDGMFYHTTFE